MLYDRIGAGYASGRRTDSRAMAASTAALGDARPTWTAAGGTPGTATCWTSASTTPVSGSLFPETEYLAPCSLLMFV
jgi:hypothetical protein